MTAIGIHDLELATAHHVVDLTGLAESKSIDPAKYVLGLGQTEMSVPAPDEDIVTMGAAAALPILERNGTEGIRTLLFATESGVDQSKAAGVSAHALLNLPSSVRVVEFKQACYAGTAALQSAIGIVSRNPGERVLIIASDVARYDLDSAAEPTQGAGAVAMLVAADPALVEIEPLNGIATADVDDFWRPNDSSTAIVDGALSVSAYLDALTGAWNDLAERGGPGIDEIDRILYHQPFTKMAKKAQQRLAEVTGAQLSTALSENEASVGRETGLEMGSRYNRRLGNSYTASLYAALAALLDHDKGLAGNRLGFFSYGSGSVSEFFTGIVQPGYDERRDAARAARMLDGRAPLEIADYRELHGAEYPSAADLETSRVTASPFRFAGIRNRARRYERS
ncbi:MAG TPA: hydroxymethylglutaryl-CoA synthase [Candidatus Agrococcus pullicola]|uniref:Hydroxymethylglutaryl-CoA synthase n=1 Tax=Candidatus Agrococcus pullicola TaxID=2838429 RepID=A0A9D1YUJ4_9MICO|nr:hydroxymethylglutaryl-CoA synthase [Candidatus Agrococcus pullicola]